MTPGKSDRAMKKKNHNLADCAVFFDFDNTITTHDVLDDIIQRFAVDDEWLKFEKLWDQGKIGSKECLSAQMKSLRVTKEALVKYLSRVRIDPYTDKLFTLLKSCGVSPVILSDSFSFIIKYILNANGIRGVKVYANTIRFRKDRVCPIFPYLNGCARCAHCKKEQLPLFSRGKKATVYIGDGLSDRCPAEVADVVFAKDRLLHYLRKKKKACRPFKNFKEIYNHFKELN